MIDPMTVNIILLFIILITAVLTVTARRLIRAAIGLAFTSAELTILMYRLDSPIAGVFELSVCTGLISVLFVSIISLTEKLSGDRLKHHGREMLVRYWLLPVILLAVGVALTRIPLPADFVPAKAAAEDVRSVLWNTRHLDLLGQIAILLAGAMGVVILFKDRK